MRRSTTCRRTSRGAIAPERRRALQRRRAGGHAEQASGETLVSTTTDEYGNLSVVRHAAAGDAGSSARSPAVLGVVLAGAGFCMSGADRFFQAYLVAYTFWMGVVARLHGAADGAAPVRRRVGHRACAGRSRRRSARCRSWRCCSCRSSLGMHSLYEWSTPEGRGRSGDPGQGAVSEHAVLPGSPGVLFPRSGSRIGHLLTRWSAEHDRTGDPALHRQDVEAVGRRAADLRPDHHVRDGRLDDVGEPALVLDDLGHALRRSARVCRRSRSASSCW